MQRWWSAKPKSQRLGHTQPRQPVVSQQQAQCQPGPPTLPWWPRHSAQGTQCLAEPGMPHSHLCTGGHVVTSPTGSGLGPIPRPARENPCPGSHGAAGGCDHTRTRRGAGQAIHPPSLTGEAAQLLCPRQSGHHAPQQELRAPPGTAEGTWQGWRPLCQAGFTLSTPAVPHTCLFLPAQGLPLLAEM